MRITDSSRRVAFLLLVAIVLAAGLSPSAGMGSSAGLAVPANLTGYWVNPEDWKAPAWHLTAGSGLTSLSGDWTGGTGHSDLKGTFTATGKGDRGYNGTFHIAEGDATVDGTIGVDIFSPNEITITLQNSSCSFQCSMTPTSFHMIRLVAVKKHLRDNVGPNSKQYDPTWAWVTWNATVTICNHDPFFLKPFSLSKTAVRYTTLVVGSEPKHTRIWYMPSPHAPDKPQRSLTPVGEPGSCGSFSVHNTSANLVRLQFFDEIHAEAKMTLVIEPKP